MSWYQHFPDNEEISDYMLRLINECQCFGADFHECHRTLERIISSDDSDAWMTEWLATAEATRARGDAAAARGHSVSARNAYLRAYTYYRSAEYKMPPTDARIPVYEAGIECFQKAGRYFRPPLERIEIPFDGGNMPAFFYPCEGAHQRPRPVVIMFPGADSTKEELLFQGGWDLLERGVSCIMVDGPGQGETIHLQGIPIRHDAEAPVGAVIDYLSTRSEVDPARIGLVGISMGGYYAIRAAAFEKRIKAAIAWSAIYDVVEDVYDFFPPIRPQLQWISRTASDRECREHLASFRLEGVVGQVDCPLLVTHGSRDLICDPAALTKIAKGASEGTEVRMWTPEEGGSAHVLADNYAQALPFMFDWLLDHLVGRPRLQHGSS